MLGTKLSMNHPLRKLIREVHDREVTDDTKDEL
jgi:hypothetical protein